MHQNYLARSDMSPASLSLGLSSCARSLRAARKRIEHDERFRTQSTAGAGGGRNTSASAQQQHEQRFRGDSPAFHFPSAPWFPLWRRS